MIVELGQYKLAISRREVCPKMAILEFVESMDKPAFFVIDLQISHPSLSKKHVKKLLQKHH